LAGEAVSVEAVQERAGRVSREIWRDLAAHWRRAPTPVVRLWPLWMALAVLGLAALLFVGVHFDMAAARAAKRLDPSLVAFYEAVTRAGKSDWLFALAVLTIFYGLSRRERAPDTRRRAAWGLVASRGFYFLIVMAFSGIAAQIVKHIVGRARPALIALDGPFHFDLFSLKSVLASFPSGHTTTVFAAFAALTLLAPRVGPAFLLIALPVAASRIIVGAHYPSDVCGGLCLGLASALIVARVFARRRIAFTLAPDALLPKARGAAAIRALFS
jgi:undecaprenyl-diphosphatase